MTEPIDLDHVEAVLLADGWHHVLYHSFDITPFAFVKTDGAGVQTSVAEVGTGFAFGDQDPITGDVRRIGGPLSALLAVKYRRREDDADDDGVFDEAASDGGGAPAA